MTRPGSVSLGLVLLSSCLLACSSSTQPPVDGAGGAGGSGGSGGGGGGGAGGSGPEVGDPPSIQSFTATPTTTGPGAEIVLRWVVSGSMPLQLSIDGEALAEGMSSIALLIGETHTFRLEARNDFGSDAAEVRVEVEQRPWDGGIFPAHAAVEPGERQRFYATEETQGEWTSSCGSIESTEDGSMVWVAPAHPARCTIHLDYPHALAAAEVEVDEATPTVTAIEGLSGPSNIPYPFVWDSGDSFVAPGWGVLMEYELGRGTWTASLLLERFEAARLLSGPDGVLHALGGFTRGGYEAAWLRKEPGMTEWLAGPAPAAAEDSSTWAHFGSTAAPNGTLCVAPSPFDGAAGVYCSDTEGSWMTIAELPREVSSNALGFDGEGNLHLGSASGAIYRIEGGELERIGSADVWQVADLGWFADQLHAVGEGVYRWDPDASEWIDLSGGLPEGCSTFSGRCRISSIASVDLDLFAIAPDGLYGKTPTASFERISDFPPGMISGIRGGTLVVRDSELWFANPAGLWRTEPWSGEWQLATVGGTEFGRHPTAIAFHHDGTIAFAAESFNNDNDPVYLLAPGARHWRELGPGLLPTYHHVAHISFRDDGALAFGTRRVGGGVGTTGLLYFVEPGADSYRPLPQEALPPWTLPGAEKGTRLSGLRWASDGGLLAAIDTEGVFRLAPGSERWEPLGPPIQANHLVLLGDRVLVATSGGVVELADEATAWAPVGAPRFHETWRAAEHLRLGVSDDGALWVATSRGVFTLEPDDGWLPAGSGECSVASIGVYVGGGRAYCAFDHRQAELHRGRWTRLPGIDRDSHWSTAIEAGPDGSLYLDFGVTLRGSLVRTLP